MARDVHEADYERAKRARREVTRLLQALVQEDNWGKRHRMIQDAQKALDECGEALSRLAGRLDFYAEQFADDLRPALAASIRQARGGE